MTKTKDLDPNFSRGDVARILNVHPLTVANREKRKQYPEPRRDLNGYRKYSLNDVFNLQLLTNNLIDPRPVISILWDKGYRNERAVAQMIDSCLARRKGAI